MPSPPSSKFSASIRPGTGAAVPPNGVGRRHAPGTSSEVVQVAQPSGCSVRIDDDPQHVGSGGQRNAADDDRPPRLPAAGVRHHQRTGRIDAVDLDMKRSASSRLTPRALRACSWPSPPPTPSTSATRQPRHNSSEYPPPISDVVSMSTSVWRYCPRRIARRQIVVGNPLSPFVKLFRFDQTGDGGAVPPNGVEARRHDDVNRHAPDVVLAPSVVGRDSGQAVVARRHVGP